MTVVKPNLVEFRFAFSHGPDVGIMSHLTILTSDPYNASNNLGTDCIQLLDPSEILIRSPSGQILVLQDMVATTHDENILVP